MVWVSEHFPLPSGFVPKRSNYAACWQSSHDGAIVCPIEFEQPLNQDAYNHEIRIRGHNGCEIASSGVTNWSNEDQGRKLFRFHLLDGSTTLNDVNQCLVSHKEFEIFGYVDPAEDPATLMRLVRADEDGGDTDLNDRWGCNNLLKQFHRTVEVDGVPEWQPAIVSQVCLAEGTTAFVNLGELAAAVLIEDLVPATPAIHPPGFVASRSTYPSCWQASSDGHFVCPINDNAVRDSDYTSYGDPVDIFGTDECMIPAASVSSWVSEDQGRKLFRFEGREGVTLEDVNDCLKASESFYVRVEPRMTRNHQNCTEGSDNAGNYICGVEVQQPVAVGEDRPVYVHGKDCTFRAETIHKYAWKRDTDRSDFYFGMGGERHLEDEINECLPPDSEFSITYIDEDLETNNQELAEEFVGDLLRCSEELFYSNDRLVSCSDFRSIVVLK